MPAGRNFRVQQAFLRGRGAGIRKEIESVNNESANLDEVRDLVNELKSDFNLLLAKLDADAGVTDTNYASTRTVSSPDVTL